MTNENSAIAQLIETVLADTAAVSDDRQATIIREGRANTAQSRFLAAMNWKLAPTAEAKQSFAEEVMQTDRTYRIAGEQLLVIEARIAAKKRAELKEQAARVPDAAPDAVEALPPRTAK